MKRILPVLFVLATLLLGCISPYDYVEHGEPESVGIIESDENDAGRIEETENGYEEPGEGFADEPWEEPEENLETEETSTVENMGNEFIEEDAEDVDIEENNDGEIEYDNEELFEETEDTLTGSNEYGEGATAAIYTNPGIVKIAPFTALFSGVDSIPAQGAEIAEWTWDFGDSSQGEPQKDRGMIVAHKYTQPGVYTITLNVIDSNGKTGSTSIQIKVEEFEGETFYVSNSGNDSGDGSINAPWKTLGYANEAIKSASKPRKLLLKKGDVWKVNNEKLAIGSGTFVGAYGEGSKPRIELLGKDAYIQWNGNEPDEMVRFEGIHVYGDTPNSEGGSVFAYAPASTIRDCVFENSGVIATLQGQGLVVEDSSISRASRQGIFAEGNDIAIRRNDFFASGSSYLLDHQIYFSKGNRWFIEDNVFDGGGESAENNFAAKINSGTDVVLRGNESKNTRNGFSLGANKPTRDKPTSNVVLENCISHDNGKENQSSGVYIAGAEDIIIRNCIIYNHSGSAIQVAEQAEDRESYNGIADMRIYNNTFYANEKNQIIVGPEPLFDLDLQNNIFFIPNEQDIFRIRTVLGSNKKISGKNNLFYSTGSGEASFIVDDKKIGFAEMKSMGLNNSLCSSGNDGVCGEFNPMFVSGNPSNANGFKIQNNSPAIDAGNSNPFVVYDYSGNSRPKGNAIDTGAFEIG